MADMEKPPKSVHIAPMGVENERISQPAIDYEADRMILLEYLPRTPPLDDVHDELKTALSDAEIGFETVRADFDDMFEGLATIAETIEALREKDEVYVNVSSGNKVAAIAGMIACMTTGRATPYYVKAEEQDSNFPQPSPGGPSQGIRSVEKIPRFPMDRPKREHLEIMGYIDRQETETRDSDEPFAERGELIKNGEKEGHPFIANYEGETEKGKYQRLRHHITDPLEDRGYIRTEDHRSSTRIKLTEDGRNTLRAFSYVLD